MFFGMKIIETNMYVRVAENQGFILAKANFSQRLS